MKGRLALAFLVASLVAVACSSEIQPAQPDKSTVCAGCRMMVSDLRFAAQLVAPGEEPRFFDDIGCMRKYAAAHRDIAWTGFVSDYHTKEWIRADTAKYWKCDSIETPMSSKIVAAAEKPAADCVAEK